MALSIARAYAQAGSRVLLIDCDLRRPSVHRQIGQEPDMGIMDYLTGEVGGKTLKDIVVEDQVKGLELLVGARRSDTATDQLLASPAFETLIAAAKRVFDVVILDAPPVGPVIDGIYLARRADAIVFVVRWANTPQPEIRAAITALSDVIGPEALDEDSEWAYLISFLPGLKSAGGTEAILRNTIGERVLGLPPEPRLDKGIPFSELRAKEKEAVSA